MRLKGMGRTAAAAICALLSICSLGCGEKTAQAQEPFCRSFDFAAVQTSDCQDRSALTYYSEGGDILCSRTIDYGNLSDIFKPGIVKGSTVYLFPEGKSPQRGAHCVLAIDLNNGMQRIYELGEKETRVLGMAANEDHLYVSSNLNGVSTVSKCSILSGKRASKEMEGCIIDHLYAGEDTVYAFGCQLEDETYSLYELDADSLRVLHRTDLNTPLGPADTLQKGDTLYFSLSADLENYPQSRTRLGCYDTRNKRVKWMDFSGHRALKDIRECENLLFLSHTQLPEGTGHEVTVLDPKTGSRKEFSFNEDIAQMEVRGDRIYFLSYRGQQAEGTVTQYRYTGNSFKKVCTVRIKANRGRGDFYIGSFWLKGELQ